MHDRSGVYRVCKLIGLALNQRGVHPQLNGFGRGDKNRTRISGFGDRCTAIVLHPYMRFDIIA